MDELVKIYLREFENQNLPPETLQNIEAVFRGGLMTGIHFALNNVVLLNHVPPGFIPKPSIN